MRGAVASEWMAPARELSLAAEPEQRRALGSMFVRDLHGDEGSADNGNGQGLLRVLASSRCQQGS